MTVDWTLLQEEIERRVTEIRDERLEGLDPRTLRWLALLPEWTAGLAAACDFPPDGAPLDQLLERGRRTRLCETRHDRAIDGSVTLRFWMPKPTRSTLFAQWQREDGPSMRDDAAEIARRVLDAIERGEEVSPGAARWARLASKELAADATPGETLTHEVTGAIGTHDTATALEWIFAGEELAKPLGAEMELAVKRARRQLNLHYRAQQDEHDLMRFVEREEQLDEVRRLLESEDQWASHFIGPSGVGKTMLLRYLTNRNPKVGPVISASLIDFDYIDPRYPLERPARLLDELAHGLEDSIEDDTQESLLRSFRDAVADVEALDSGADDPLATPQFSRVISAFAGFVSELPQPVLLILDTCEELAKLHPAGEDVPSITATFDIIERVHELVPEVRVAFAGRRWLTPMAANKQRDDATPGSVMSLEPREYLHMHEVRGFTRDEAVGYLTGVLDLELDESTIDAVLERAPEPGRTPSYDDAEEASAESRYNPVDLELFGDWLARDPELSVETIRAGDFALYVQKRIIDRLRTSPEILNAIPAAVALERFDSVSIEPALGSDPNVRSLALAGLIEQEWTHLEGGPDPKDILLEIDAGLLPRLRSYYRDAPERREQLETAQATLAPHLADLLDSPPDELSVDLVDAALRLLEPPVAVALFDRLAARVAKDRAWSWAEAVCGRLLSEEREERLDPALRPSVRALYVAALTQRGTSVDLGRLWQKVATEAYWHPDLEQAVILTARGRLGAVRARAAGGKGEADKHAVAAAYEMARPLLDRPKAMPVLVPSLVATIEVLVDLGERGVEIPPTLVHGCIEWLDERFESEATRAYVLTLAGRLHATRGDWSAARKVFERVSLMDVDNDDHESSSADWVEPASRSHRALLELLRFRLADHREDDALLDRCEGAALAHPGNIDAAQLLSLVLQARLANGTLTADTLNLVADYEPTVAACRPTAPAHRVAPPLFVSIADGWMALGRAEEARDLLASRERLAISRRSDEEATRAAVLGSLGVMRRLRLRDRLALVSGLSSSIDEELRSEALAAGALIVGLQPALGRATDHDHAAWRARILLGAEGPEEALEPAPAREETVRESPIADFHAELDRFEAELIRRRTLGRRGDPSAAAEIRRRAAMFEEQRSLRDPLGVEWLRLSLRLHALVDAAVPIHIRRQQLIGRLSLDEGELLALRLPGQAAGLLWLAEHSFENSGDAYAAFIAALRAAIAEVHAGRTESARGRRQAILAHYERIQRVDPALPTAQTLLTGDGWDPARSDKSLLRAWLRRLATYLRWCESPTSPHDGIVSTLGLEPELALLPTPGSTPAVVTPSRRAWLRRYGRLGGLVAVLIAAAFTVGIALGGPALGLAAIGAVLLATPLAETIGSVLPRLVLPVDGFDISVAPTRSRRLGHAAEAELRLAPRTRHRAVEAYLHLLRAFRERRWVGTMPILDDRSDEVPPRPIARAIRPRFVGRRYIPLRLIVTPDLAPFGWERRLASHAMVDLDAARGHWPRIWRVRPEGLFRRPPVDLPAAIVATCSPSWRPFVERTTAGIVETLGHPKEQLDKTRDSKPEARAVVALGAPVITRAGWRLHVDDERLRTEIGEQQRQSLEQSGRRVLEAPDRLVREAPIVIVFGQPGGSRPTKQRRTTDGLRGFANEVFLAGGHAVIVVPVLPTATAAEVLAKLTREIDSWSTMPDAEQLARLADTLRTTIYRGLYDGDDDSRPRRIELALEVCLFAPR